MPRYITMTTGGLYGDTYEAPCDDDAIDQAENDGYVVEDVMDSNLDGETMLLLVVRGGHERDSLDDS